MNNKLPRHVAIIMDGNGRWAKRRMLPRFAGHQAGVRAVREVVAGCAERGIEALTLFAFSSENWRRPAKEVGLLMDLLRGALQREVGKLHENNVRMRVIGDRAPFAPEIQQGIERAEALTEGNSGLNLSIAINYGGRWDIARAAQALALQVQAGTLNPADITPELLEAQLALSDLPPVDLFIRSGGEQRISNFLIWQLVYSELYFTDVLWPDFGRAALDDALASFGARQRRFGRTGEQVEALQHA